MLENDNNIKDEEETLLAEVLVGEYFNFRKYLCEQTNICLKPHFDVNDENKMKHYLEALQGIPVKKLSFAGKNLVWSPGYIALCERLPFLNIEALDLSHNNQMPFGFEKLFRAAQKSRLHCVYLKGFNLEESEIRLIAQLVPHTMLVKISVGRYSNEDTHPVLEEALEKNRQKYFVTPYYAACLYWYPEEKKKKYRQLGFIGEYFRNANPTAYAGGILMSRNLPADVRDKIISYLPFMEGENKEKSKKPLWNIKKAEQYHENNPLTVARNSNCVVS